MILFKDDQVVRYLSAECSHGKREALGSSSIGPRYFLPCDIWWLSVGSRLGPRASKRACLVHSSVVPSRFEDESGKMSKVNHVARLLCCCFTSTVNI